MVTMEIWINFLLQNVVVASIRIATATAAYKAVSHILEPLKLLEG